MDSQLADLKKIQEARTITIPADAKWYDWREIYEFEALDGLERSNDIVFEPAYKTSCPEHMPAEGIPCPLCGESA